METDVSSLGDVDQVQINDFPNSTFSKFHNKRIWILKIISVIVAADIHGRHILALNI